MANTCCSSYTFYGNNEAMLKALNRFLENVVNDRRKGTNLVDGRRNLYDGIYAQHLAGIPEKEWTPARSEISTLDDIRVDLAGNYYFQMVANDAWSPQPEGWQAVLDKKFPGISLAYQGEEEGCGVFVYHDPTGLYYTDRYIVDAYLEGNSNVICEESEYFETEKDCLSFCKEKLKEFFEVHDTAFYMDDYTDIESVKSLMNRSFEMLNDNERFAIHEFEGGIGVEYVIYDNLDYDAYKETARENLEANGNANPTEEEISSEVDFLMQNDWYDVKNALTDFFKTDTWLARGTFGDWTMSGEGGLVFKSFETLYEAVCCNCDYVKIWDEDGHFHMSGTHHDGTNHVEVVKLSKKGKDIWYEWKAAGEDSDLMNYSRKAMHKLLAERYSELPNYART